MMDPELVSVVIPTHNRAELLARALTSAGEQVYRPLEVVVVDDGSVDDTEAVVERSRMALAERGVSVQFERLAANSGPAAARNAGVRAASGSLLAFLDSDDLWRPEFVSRLAGLFQRYPSCGLAFSGALGIDADERVIARHESGLAAEPAEGVLHRPFELLVRKMPFLTPAVLVRRDALERVGAFDESLRLASDWDFWYRLAKQTDFAYTLDPLVSNRHHTGNLGKNRAAGFAYLVRVSLHHLDSVQDERTRRILVARIQRTLMLLQEELLREGRHDAEYTDLLDSDLAPGSLRYRAGRWARRTPAWLGRWYAGAVRGAGRVRRLLAST